jgi:hypothetical protein
MLPTAKYFGIMVIFISAGIFYFFGSYVEPIIYGSFVVFGIAVIMYLIGYISEWHIEKRGENVFSWHLEKKNPHATFSLFRIGDSFNNLGFFCLGFIVIFLTLSMFKFGNDTGMEGAAVMIVLLPMAFSFIAIAILLLLDRVLVLTKRPFP